MRRKLPVLLLAPLAVLPACGSRAAETEGQETQLEELEDVPFNNELYRMFHARFIAEGGDDVTANCLAGVFSSTTLWHGEEVGHNAGEQDPNQTSEQFASYHPFLRATKNINCSGPRGDWEKYGKSVEGDIWVDVAGLCLSNSEDPTCDDVERHRVTFVVARQAAHAYCFELTGSSSCGHPVDVGRCLATRYAHEYMLVPLPGDAYSYDVGCADIPLDLNSPSSPPPPVQPG